MFKSYSSLENFLEIYIMAWKDNHSRLGEKQQAVDQMIYDPNCIKVNYVYMWPVWVWLSG